MFIKYMDPFKMSINEIKNRWKNFLNFFRKDKIIRVMVLGEEQSGRTSLIQKLKHGEINFNATAYIQTIEYKNTHLILLDVQNTELTLSTQFTKADVVIIVVNSTTIYFSNWNKNIADFFKTPTHPLYSKPLLVYANKQDLPR